MPPLDSIIWNSAQIFSHNSAANVSTYQEPPTGSTGWRNSNSVCNITWMLRAIRREKSSALRIGWSNGETSRLFKPPTTPENACVVLRNKFTYGSYTVFVKADVLPCTWTARSASSAPNASMMRAQSTRNARNLAISMKKLAPMENVNIMLLAMVCISMFRCANWRT